jgi:pyruvate dehydrogenase E1 component alpha subunit/2-oxoisovalerate dehydrogenase E1 component alpha subunit
MSTAKRSTSRPEEGGPRREPAGGGLTQAARLEIYTLMLLTRRLEEALSHLYRQGKVVGGLYLGTGQEATSVASAFALGPDDWIGPVIRDAGAMLARGVAPREILAQYMAKADGPTGGRDTTLHFGGACRRIVAPSSMLGSLVPVMAGVALAARMRGSDAVALTYIGDGATSTGAFHEGMNFATARKVPLVVIGENNLYAYSTPVSEQMGIADLADRAKAYGMPSEIVDGNDADAVYAATRRAVERARSWGGPSFIEAKTMRMRGHAEHDDARYVPAALLEEWRSRDPIARTKAVLLGKGGPGAAALEAVEERVRSEIAESVAAAEAGPMPDPDSALRHVYVEDGPWPYGPAPED